MRIRLTQMVRIAMELDSIAEDLEKEDPRSALAVDFISDWVERKAYTPTEWLPGRSPRPYHGFRRTTNFTETLHYGMVCPQCNYCIREASCGIFCPKCGNQMVATAPRRS